MTQKMLYAEPQPLSGWSPCRRLTPTSARLTIAVATWLNFHFVQETPSGELPEVQDAVLDALAILDFMVPAAADTTVLPAWYRAGSADSSCGSRLSSS